MRNSRDTVSRAIKRSTGTRALLGNHWQSYLPAQPPVWDYHYSLQSAASFNKISINMGNIRHFPNHCCLTVQIILSHWFLSQVLTSTVRMTWESNTGVSVVSSHGFARVMATVSPAWILSLTACAGHPGVVILITQGGDMVQGIIKYNRPMSDVWKKL